MQHYVTKEPLARASLPTPGEVYQKRSHLAHKFLVTEQPHLTHGLQPLSPAGLARVVCE
jgi:hypothetical protein